MYLSQSGLSRFLAASCAFSGTALLLSGATPAHARPQTRPKPQTRLIVYMSRPREATPGLGSLLFPPMAATAALPNPGHAQETLNALAAPGLSRPVEITVDPAVCSAQDFLGRWFSAAPNTPVIWHADSARTVLIYTPAMSQQIDALAAEDFAHAAEAPITRFYVAPSGSDAWRGATPAEDADNGPFRTLEHAQEAVAAFLTERPGAPVEVVFEPAHS
ncbi:MAG: hypothetical protein FRX48_09098 [Lasallia pustulata]|uniref:Uncharacterized protein n=1 Tax=Lasallia pustulata TaxID=136370 RepID=A0A5M8PE99_9LECA|nr:MAG: hypothetical protein FRX48_09098 [Lasallia pustulata]